MFSFNFLRWLKSSFRRRTKTYSRSTRVVFRLEELETRLAPATISWTGGGGLDTRWSVGTNWSGGVAPTTTPLLDDLSFGDSTPLASRTMINDLNLAVKSITVTGSNYIFTGNALTLGSPTVSGSGSIIVNSGGTGTDIRLNLQLAGQNASNQFFTVNSGGDLIISGQISGVTGAEVTKQGIGTLTLTGDNTSFSGPFTIANDAGIVNITHAKALGATNASEVQTVALAGSALGKFNLSFNGSPPTADLDFAATETDVRNALNALPTIAPNAVTVLRSGNTFFITFNGGALAGTNVVPLVATGVSGTTATVNTLTEGGSFAGTTVGQNSQLQVSSIVGGTIFETVVLNGTGLTNDGALLSTTGTNIWGGSVILGSVAPTIFLGVSAGSSLEISGRISEQAAVENITKRGFGQLILSHSNGNTYRGLTTIDNGLVTIRHPQALGTADATPGTGTIVNSTAILGTGSLQLDGAAFAGGGFTVVNEHLTINDDGLAGAGGLGALYNLSGNNNWNGPVFLGSALNQAGSVSIGVNAGTDLTITGNNPTFFALNDAATGGPTPVFKIGAGRLILPTANTSYTSSMTISQGVISLRDSLGLGPTTPTSGGTSVNFGAALHLEVDGFVDSLTGNTRSLQVSETLSLSGTGINNTGALRSISGVNNYVTRNTGNVISISPEESNITSATWAAGVVTITTLNTHRFLNGQSVVISGMHPFGYNGTFVINSVTGNTFRYALAVNPGLATSVGSALSGAAIGVDADPGASFTDGYFTNDYSLTVTGGIGGNDLHKVGAGHLILPNTNNYSGITTIAQGWITARTETALGAFSLSNVGDTASPAITVQNNAALHIMPLTATVTAATWTANVATIQTSAPHGFAVGQSVVIAGMVPGGYNGTFIITGTPTTSRFTYDLVIPDPGPGTTFGTAALNFNYARNLILDGTGIAHNYSLINGKGALMSLGGDNIIGGPFAVTPTNIRTSNILLNNTVGIGVERLPSFTTGSLVITGQMHDGSSAGGITKFGSRRLTLQNANSFSGAVSIREGVLTAQHDMAFGLPGGGVTVENSGASEVQRLVVTGSSASDAFRLSYNRSSIITNATWNAGEVVVTTSVPHHYAVGETVTIAGMTPAGYNGPFVITAVTATTFTYALAANPGAATVLGTAVVSTNTAPILFGTSAPALQTILNNTPSLFPVGATVSVHQTGNNTYFVTFNGLLGNGFNANQLQVFQLIGAANVTVTTMIEGDGTALELKAGLPQFNGGISAGLQIWGEPLTIKGNIGNSTLGANDTPLTITAGEDDLWRGPVSLDASATITIPQTSRLTLFGTIDDAGNTSASGSDIRFIGGGELSLFGANTYRGNTFIDQGIATIENAQALGTTGVQEIQTLTLPATVTSWNLTFNGSVTTPDFTQATTAAELKTALEALTTIGGVGGTVSVALVGNVYSISFGGALSGFNQPKLLANTTAGTDVVAIVTTRDGSGATIVATGAQLQMQGGITVAGEALLLSGDGVDAGSLPSVPLRWFSTGPAPITNGQTPGNMDVSGRITSVTADPTDARVLYATAAGGGAWKSTNNGLTWTPLFDRSDLLANITTLSETGLSVTVTTASPHGYYAGQAVVIAGASVAGYNGTFRVVATPTANTFTYTVGAALAAATGGTATVSTKIFAGSIAVAPSNPHIIYIGTGEGNNTGDSYYGSGVFKSIDSGLTWRLVQNAAFNPDSPANPLERQVINKIIVDPSDADRIYVATSDRGVFSTLTQATIRTGSVTNATWDQGVATFTTAVAHGYSVGQQIRVTGMTPAGYNGDFVVTTVINPTSFSYALPANPGLPAFGVTNNIRISSAVWSAAPNIVTITTTIAHGFTSGQRVTISGITPVGYNGSFIITVLTGTTFRYSLAVDPGLATTTNGTATNLVVSSATWTAGVVTITTPMAHGYAIGQQVNISGMVAAGYNGTVTITGTPTATSFTYDRPVNPGAASTLGTINNPIVTATWAAGTATVTTGAAHGYTSGQTVNVTGMSAAGYNGNFVVTVLTTTSFTYAVGTNPGAVGPPFGTVRNLQTAPGVFRFDSAGSWINLTAIVSPNRTSVPSNLPGNAIVPNPPEGTPVTTPPVTAGPDDNYRVVFPQSNASWSDIALSLPDVNGNRILYAALGTSSGSNFNGVYRLKEPHLNAPTLPFFWLAGDPINGPDTRSLAWSDPVNEVQTLAFGPNISSFTLSYRPDAMTTNTSGPLNYTGSTGPDLATILNALNALVGAGNSVTVTSPAANNFTITFRTGLAGTNQLQVTGNVLATTGNVITAATTTDGGPFNSPSPASTAFPRPPVVPPAAGTLNNGNIKLSVVNGVGISNATWAGNVVTITTGVPHGFAVGNSVTISGMTPAGYNGTFAITGTTATTFTYTLIGNPGPATIHGTVVASPAVPTNEVQRITFTGTIVDFKLTYNGNETGVLTESTASIAAGLNLGNILGPWIGTNGVVVTSVPGQRAFDITFANNSVAGANVLQLVPTAITTPNNGTVVVNTFREGAGPTVYAAVSNTAGNLTSIQKTVDGGRDWITIATPATMPQYLNTQGNTDSTILAPTANSIFVGGAFNGVDSARDYTSSVFFSNDGGVTWTDVTSSNAAIATATWLAGTVTVTTTTAHGFSVGQSVVIAGMVPAGYNGTFVVTGTPTLTTFTYALVVNPGATTTIGTASASSGVHTGQHSMTLDRDGRLLLSNDGGVWRLQNAAPGLIEWDSLNGNLAVSQVNGVAQHPSDLNRILSGSNDNGTANFTGAQNWIQSDVGDGGLVAYDPKNPNIAYHVRNIRLISNIVTATSVGTTVTITTASAHGYVTGESVIIAGVGNTAYNGTFTITSHTATTFTYTRNPAPGGASTGGTVTANFTTSLMKTLDGGLTWNSVLDGSSTYFPFTVDQNNPSRILAALIVNGVPDLYESFNGGTRNPTTGATTFARLFVPAFGININNAAWNNGIVTVTTASPHGFALGQQVTITNVTVGGIPSGYNGTVIITGVTGTTFTYLLAGNPGVADLFTGTVTATFSAISAATYQGTFVADAAFPAVTDKGASALDADTIYITNGNTVALTKNHGLNWVDRSPVVVGGSISDIKVDPSNRDTVYVTLSNFSGVGGSHVLKSTNAGVTWTSLSTGLPDLPTWKLAIDSRTNDLYVGNDIGIYKLTGGVGSWTRMGVGLPNVQIKDLVLSTDLNILSAGTYGRSMYQFYLNDVKADSGALRAVSGNNVWTGPIRLAGDTVITVNGSQALQSGLAAAQLNVVGVISDATYQANFKLTKDGQGDLILSGANTFGGLTDIKTGVLVVQNSQALGDFRASGADITAQGGTIVNAGTALVLRSDLALEGVELNGNGASQSNLHFTGALRNASNNNTYTGPLTLKTNSTIGVDTSSSLTIGTSAFLPGTGTIGGDLGFGFDKELTGTLILNSANTYTGITNVNQGVLQIQHSAALGAADGLPATGTKVLDGSQLQLATPTSGPNAGVPVVVGTESLAISGTGTNSTGALLNVGGNNVWAGPITFDYLPAFSPASVPPNFVSINVNAGSMLTLDGVINQDTTPPSIHPSFGLTKIGTGKLSLTKANTYSGQTNVMEGVLNISNSNALGTIGAQTSTVVQTGAALELQGGISVVATEDLILNGTGITGTGALRNVAGSNAYAGSVTLQTNSSIGADPTTQLTISGIVQDLPIVPVPASTLTKVGTGTVVLTGNNTYHGQTFVNEGVLNIRHDRALGINPNEVQRLTVNGTSDTYTLNFDGQITNPILPGASASFIQNELNNLSTINAGGGSVSVTQVGNVYTVVFSGAPLATFNQNELIANPIGTTTVLVTTIQDGAVGGGTIVANGATLQTQGGIAVAIEELTLNGNGFLGVGALDNASGNNTWNGPVILASNSSIGSSTAGDRLTLNTAITQTTAGLGVTKVGPGTLQYAGATANAYTGVTNVYDGLLELNKSILNGGAVIGDLVVGQPSNEVQSLFIPATVTSFELTFNTNVTAPIAYTGVAATDAAAIAAALNLPTILGAGGSVTVTPSVANTFVITFGGTLTGANQTQITATTLAGTGTITPLTTADGGPFVADRDSVRLLAANQIANASLVTVNGDGFLNLDGFTEEFGALTINDGHVRVNNLPSTAGSLTVPSLTMTGGLIDNAGAASALHLNGNVTATSSAASRATITGLNGVIDMAGVSRTFTVDNGPNATDLAIGNIVNNGPSLIKTGSGRLQLTTGGDIDVLSTINAGDLQVDAGANANDIELNQLDNTKPASLSGTGSVGRISGSPTPGTAAVGTVNPGANGVAANTGILSSGNAVWGAGTTFFVNLDNPDGLGIPVAGTEYDQLAITGNIDLGGATLAGLVGANVQISDSFTILTTTGQISGLLTGLLGATTGTIVDGGFAFVGGVKFFVDYDFSLTNGSIVLTRVLVDATSVITAVPGATTVYGQLVTYTVTITPEAGAGLPASGANVAFSIDGGLQTTTVPVVVTGGGSSGTATLDPQTFFAITWTGNSSHTINATMTSPGFNPSIATQFTQTVNQASTNIVITPVPTASNFGQPVVLSALVSAANPGNGGPTNGVLSFYRDSIANFLGLGVLTGSTYNFTTSGDDIPVGTHSIIAVFETDTNLQNKTETLTGFVVSKAATAITSIATSASPVFGAPMTLTIEVTSTSPGNPGSPTGTVTVVDTIPGLVIGTPTITTPTSTMTRYTYSFNAPTANPAHNLTVSFAGTGNYASSANAPHTFAVAQADTSVALNSSAPIGAIGAGIVYTATVTTDLPSTAAVNNGTVTFRNTTNGQVLGTSNVTLVAGVGTATLNSTLTLTPTTYVPGINQIRADYTPIAAPTNFIASSSALFDQSVLRGVNLTYVANPSPSVFGQTVNVTVNATAADGNPPTPTGTVSVFEGATLLGSGAVGATIPLTGPLALGTHNLTIIYGGNATYAPATITRTQIVAQSPTTTAVGVFTPVIFGQMSYFEATVTASFGGTPTTAPVTFFDGAVSLGTGAFLSSNLTSTTYSFTTSVPLSVGNHSITAKYTGSANFMTSTSSPAVTHVVSPSPTTTTIFATVSPSKFGQLVTLNAHVDSTGGVNPSGTVTFFDGSSAIGTTALNLLGDASLGTFALPTGSRTITAVFNSNINFTTSGSGSITHVVNKADTSTSVTSNAPVSAVYGQSVTFTITVVATSGGQPGTPTGFVNLFDDGTLIASGMPLTNGSVSFSTTAPIAVGPNSITAIFAGSTNYATSTSLGINQTVVAANTTTTMSSSPVFWAVNQTITFFATVTANSPSTAVPTGTVIFRIDGVDQTPTHILASGLASRTHTFTTTGSHTVQVLYVNDNANFNPSVMTPQTQNVRIATEVYVGTSLPEDALDIEPITFYATVSSPGGIPTGLVVFYDNGVAIGSGNLNSSGLATFTSAPLTTGIHAITAAYLGDATFNPAFTVTPLSQIVVRNRIKGRLSY